MGLEEEYMASWLNYIISLNMAYIHLMDKDDELVWKHALCGVYTPKLGSIQLNITFYLREPFWWWKGLWKFRWCPMSDCK